MSLHKAVRKSNSDEVRNLLQTEGTAINSRDTYGNTPLHFVSDNTIASLLIESGADLNLQNQDGDTTLHTWHRPNFEQNDLDDLLNAAPERKLELISLLLESGASPNIQNNFGYNALHSSLAYGGIAGIPYDGHFMNKVISLLIQFNVDVNMGDFEGCTPLHHAVKEPHVFNAETLVAAGALVNARDYRGLTPLQHIFHSDNTDMAQLLLKYKADINAQDMDGQSMLSTAVEVGNEEMVQFLLKDPQVRVNLADKNNVTPLHLAAAFKRVDLTAMLIQASADVNAPDSRNATPLHYATYGGTPEIVTLLLEAGADGKKKDDAGWMAVQYALSRHYCHTALPFGEKYLRDCYASSTRGHRRTADTTLDDIILGSLPADDIFTIVVPASQVHTDPLDSSIELDDLVEYTRAKSEGHISRYLHDMCTVPGVGRIPMDISEVKFLKSEVKNAPNDAGKMGLGAESSKTEVHEEKPEVGDTKVAVDYMRNEVEDIRENVEKFISKWKQKIAETDARFTGTLLQSGSVYEGTKVGEPDEFDYMLCLERLAPVCSVTFDEVTEYDKVIVHKNVEGFESSYEGFFDGQQLESGKVMGLFVDVAKKALTRLDYSLVPNEMYVEGLTEHTLIEDTWALQGTVTCNLKIKWCGLYYKQLVITVDLVPAIPIPEWPQVVRHESYLLTEDIRLRGCHLVPKSGYWRLSFSLAEKLIMQRLPWEQKSAFVGAKVILHPAVSCKFMVNDDNYALDDDSFPVLGDVLQNVGDCDGTVQDDADECEGVMTMQGNKEASTSSNETTSACCLDELGGIINQEKFSVPATIVGRTALSQSGDGATILKFVNADEFQIFKEKTENDMDGRITIGFQKQQTTDDDSDVPTETLLPFNVLSTYLLKNLFFNCIEQNAKDTTGVVVTTKQIFSELFYHLKENQPIPYYFMPTQGFCGFEESSDDSRLEKVLVARIMNSLLSQV